MLRRAQNATDDILREISGIRNQAGFTERFNRTLSDRARFHAYDELAKGDAVMASPVSAGEVQEFAVTDAEKELVAEWGSRAGEKVGRVWARVHRFARALDDEFDFATFAVWFKGLSRTEAKAVIRFLAR